MCVCVCVCVSECVCVSDVLGGRAQQGESENKSLAPWRSVLSVHLSNRV